MTLILLARSSEPGIDPPSDAPAAFALTGCAEPGRATYRFLTGRDPDAAVIDTAHSFDEHVLASILAVATAEDGPLCDRIGLPPEEIDAIARRWFPHAHRFLTGAAGPFIADDEAMLLRDLLVAYATEQSADSRWLAQMIARRAVEPNHLWEDLGLRERGELTRLLHRHFGPLAQRNTNNMRWKRFFYRMLCQDDGFLMCATPVCTDCHDFNECFGEESGESRLAQRRRDQDAKEFRDGADTTPRSRQQGTSI